MGQRLVVSEFPNDNPELHDGLVWACPTPCAPALPTLRLRPSERRRMLRPQWETRSDPRASAAPLAELAPLAEAPPEALAPPLEPVATPVPDEPAVEVTLVETVESAELASTSAEIETVTLAPTEAAEAPTAAASDFDAFIAALASILAERGATRAAASVGALLGKARLARDAFEPVTKKALISRGYIDAKSGRPTPEFSVVASAWREVLDGTSSDFSACGNSTLDVWGAELLGTLLASPSDELRRALRQRGVAAFGMLAAA